MLFAKILDDIVEGKLPESAVVDLKPTDTEIIQGLDKLKKIMAHPKNYARVLFLLGYLARKKKDYSLAINYFDEAIALDHSNAMVWRAIMHIEGQGCPQNFPEGMRLYEQAVSLGNDIAMNNLGILYRANLGRSQYDEANCLYDKAIALGNNTAMCNRARLHKNGGSLNYAEASLLYFQSFCLNKKELILDELEEIATLAQTPITQFYLLLAYLVNEQEDDAQVFYRDHAEDLAPPLLENTLALIDKLPEQQRLVEQQLELLQSTNIPSPCRSLWNYVHFRLEAKTEGYQTAYLLTCGFPDLVPKLTASECFELGNIALNDGADDLASENRSRCLTQASHFFYAAYQRNKDDKLMYALLLRILEEQEALESGQKIFYAFAASSCEEEEARLKRFTKRIPIKPLYAQEIETITHYLETQLDALNPSEHQILVWLCRRLSYNIPLTDSLSQPHIKKQISNSVLPTNNPILKHNLSNGAGDALLNEPTSVSPFFEKLSGISKSPKEKKTDCKYAYENPDRPASAPF